MTDSPSPLPPLLPTTALVPVKSRHDGWTPDKQRAFLEHLADTGCVKDAAHAVGMTETGAYRLRRRRDAAAFDAAWAAALETGIDRLASIALDRAINGTVKRTYYRGELVAEDVVHSERMLLWLLQNGRAALGRAAARGKVVANWDGAMDALGHERAAGEPEGGWRVWRDAHGARLTNFPPPPKFAGYSEGHPSGAGYCRTLTAVEHQAEDARDAAAVEGVGAAWQRRFAVAPIAPQDTLS